MRYLHILVFCLLLPLGNLSAQNLGWDAGMYAFLDNREYNSIDRPQTIFGARAWGEIGADLGPGHHFRVGLNLLHEFGADPFIDVPDITLYYQYEDERYDFLVGAFPRRGLLDYPLAMLSDTLHYYRPNIQGAYFGLKGDWGRQNVFIDWTSRQTDVDPEHFLFGSSGRLNLGPVFMENYLLMAHLAAKGIPDPDYHLRDNGGANLNLGVDLGPYLPLDTLVLKVGGLVSFDRIRGVGQGWQTPAGFLGQLEARRGFLGMTALYYRGQGHPFVYGDPYYLLKQYSRLDIYVLPFRLDKVKLKIDFAIHFVQGELDFSQQLLLSILLN